MTYDQPMISDCSVEGSENCMPLLCTYQEGTAPGPAGFEFVLSHAAHSAQMQSNGTRAPQETACSTSGVHRFIPCVARKAWGCTQQEWQHEQQWALHTHCAGSGACLLHAYLQSRWNSLYAADTSAISGQCMMPSTASTCR